MVIMLRHKRNEPCWCGSGKKYKKCHLNRQIQKPRSIWDIQTRFRELHQEGQCLHPNAGDSACRGAVIRAHSVRKSADLKAIARSGQVYQGSADYATLNKTGGRITPKLIGVNNASTFLGFCHAHDFSTFAPLENQSFGPTPEQAFLSAYRPLVKALYLKMRQLQSLELSREADKGRPLPDQLNIQDFVRQYGVGIRSALYDLTHHKALFDADLIAQDFSHICHATIQLERTPDIVCSGLTQPDATIDGTMIQDIGDVDSVLQMIAFSLLATGAGGAAIFAWRDDSDTACGKLVDSILSLPENDLPSALVRFALSKLENVFIRPSWWEALTDSERRALEDRMNHNVFPIRELDSTFLRDDGIRPVNWRVIGIEQKRT